MLTMFLHVFRGFVQRFAVIELLEIGFKVQVIARFQLGKLPLAFALLLLRVFIVVALQLQSLLASALTDTAFENAYADWQFSSARPMQNSRHKTQVPPPLGWGTCVFLSGVFFSKKALKFCNFRAFLVFRGVFSPPAPRTSRHSLSRLFSFRYSEGVTPVSFLNARLKFATLLKPQFSLICKMVSLVVSN